MRFGCLTLLVGTFILVAGAVFAFGWINSREARQTINLIRQSDDVAAYAGAFYGSNVKYVRVWLRDGGFIVFNEIVLKPQPAGVSERKEPLGFLRQVGNFEFRCHHFDLSEEGGGLSNNLVFNHDGNFTLAGRLSDPFDPLEIISNYEDVKEIAARLPTNRDDVKVTEGTRMSGEPVSYACYTKPASIPVFPSCEGADAQDKKDAKVFAKLECGQGV